MTTLDQPYAVRVYGTPAPKGSMKCVGQNGHHQLVEQLAKTVKPWRKRVHAAAAILPVTALEGPVGVEVTFTVARPTTVSLQRRAWPTVAIGAGDIDKLARVILDDLQAAGVLSNDAQVVELTARKCYPDTPRCPDRLEQPGALIRIYPIGD